METFETKFERIHDKIIEEDMEEGFDNIMGLTYLDGMVDIITQNPELRKHLHEFIRNIIIQGMNFEYPEENKEYMKDFV